MTDFELRLPFHSRDDPLDIEALDAAAALDGEDRDVAERLIWNAMVDPKLQTVGDLIDRIESASAEECRQIADTARAEAGLTTFTEIEENRRLAHERRDDPPKVRMPGPPRDASGRALQECAHPGCTTISPGDGTLAPVAAKKWWCATHEWAAADGDMDPLEPEPLRFAPGGAIALPEAEAEANAVHYQRLADRARNESRQKREQREREREALEEVRERHQLNGKPVNIGGIEVGPGGPVVNG